ncbi:MAG: hypothetical protein DLM73_05885 [Chthoniobacterales bacterium]|nr:MAG: hypothetical protein DLM73_05885 [Chthoniobacterales bacterium]
MRHQRLEIFLYVLAALIALVGLADAIYLTVQHLTGETVSCIASSGCETVLGSSYAVIGKVPVAAFGAAAYFTVFSLATLAAFDWTRVRPLFLCLVGMMLATTCWFLYLQAFVIHAFCDFCLLSAALTGLLSAIGIAIFFLVKKDAAATS